MVYNKRRYRPKKRQNQKKTVAYHAHQAASILANRGLVSLKKKLGLNTETHWLDTVETNVSVSSTMVSLADPLIIPQGDTVNSRQGASCRLTSYLVNGRVQANTLATAGTLIRIVYVLFKDGRGGTYSSGDFLDSGTNIHSFYNMGDALDATGYTILQDKMHYLAPPGQDGDMFEFNFKYTPDNHHLKWISSDTTGAAANLIDGFVRGFIMCSTGAANTPSYWAYHRVKFVDN